MIFFWGFVKQVACTKCNDHKEGYGDGNTFLSSPNFCSSRSSEEINWEEFNFKISCKLLELLTGEHCGQLTFLMMGLIAKRLFFVNKHKDIVQKNIHVIVFNSLAGTDLKQILLGLDMIA